ncbi:MAG: YopX family protein [Acetivibrionales bacterium]|jgi:hypothetical protein
MREIKFKAKKIDGGEWVQGCYCELAGRKYIIPDYSQFRDIHDADIENSFTEIIPETVCQFTGLKDKNGVDIYDGDILKIDEGHPVEVRYEKIYASFGIWRKGWAFLHYFHEAVEPENCEVIGNIHNKNKQQ